MDSFLIILLIVVGYFVFVSFAVMQADNKRELSKIALIVLLIYGCIVGTIVAIGQYLEETGLLLYVLALLYSIFFFLWKIYRLVKVRPRIQIGFLVMLISYLLAVLYITTFMRDPGSNNQVQMEVMNWLKEDSIDGFDHIFLNLVMFVPIGMLAPLITDRRSGKLVSSVSLGILFSTAIETGQLFLHSGTCDIDDILSNSLGALIGAVVVVTGMYMKQKREEKTRRYSRGKKR